MTTPLHSKERRLSELLNEALIQRIDGNDGKVTEALLSAVECAYGMGSLPDELVQIVDDIQSVRRVMVDNPRSAA